jgi:hypothetical protein
MASPSGIASHTERKAKAIDLSLVETQGFRPVIACRIEGKSLVKLGDLQCQGVGSTERSTTIPTQCEELICPVVGSYFSAAFANAKS